MLSQHPALSEVLKPFSAAGSTGREGELPTPEHTTSPTLARVLAVGSLSRLDQSLPVIDIWDPACGSGLAGHLLVHSLTSTGASVRYRGQDINSRVVEAARRRLEGEEDVELAVGDTLREDAFPGFEADLAIVDAPWGMEWGGAASAVESRRMAGSFTYGLPQRSDSTWLFISLALEKLRPPTKGGGRVAALVNPAALSSGSGSGEVRKRILDDGLLESVTRLPEGLAPNTNIPLYLLTFSNKTADTRRGKVEIADMQTQFTTERRRRQMPVDALAELESGLRSRKPGPRNRTVSTHQFMRRDTHLSRVTSDGSMISWGVTTYNNTTIDDDFLLSRYGPNPGVVLTGRTRETVDFDPSALFGRDEHALSKSIEAHGWPPRRLSTLVKAVPQLLDVDGEQPEGRVFVPTGAGPVTADAPPLGVTGRILALELEPGLVHPAFLAAWLNSSDGAASRQLALSSAASGSFLRVVRSDERSLARWADELLVPVPGEAAQIALVSADEKLRSFQAELEAQRATIWAEPETVSEIVSRFERAFDDSLSVWLEQLPFPIAAALWTAATAATAGEQQRAYLHAWEGIATFHATVLLAACRTDPGLGAEVESSIRATLQSQGIGIERATLKTWVVIAEKCSRELRRIVETGDADDVARVRRAFADLSRNAIERLISRDVIRKFNDVNTKRNRWHGHSGFTPATELQTQVEDLESDLRDLKAMLGDVWSQLRLVRAGRSSRTRTGWEQEAEIAIGTRSPFATEKFAVGDAMMDRELYLVRQGSESPLPLGNFIQLRSSPSSAQFTTYFYNRTEGSNVRMVSYQHGPVSEFFDDAGAFREQFGGLMSGDLP